MYKYTEDMWERDKECIHIQATVWAVPEVVVSIFEPPEQRDYDALPVGTYSGAHCWWDGRHLPDDPIERKAVETHIHSKELMLFLPSFALVKMGARDIKHLEAEFPREYNDILYEMCDRYLVEQWPAPTYYDARGGQTYVYHKETHSKRIIREAKVMQTSFLFEPYGER